MEELRIEREHGAAERALFERERLEREASHREELEALRSQLRGTASEKSLGKRRG
jgi:hypothetical protein